MKAPETPDNEGSRLQALRSLDILDTQPERRFDRLTRMAKRMFDVPIALVSLVDENRQWFKSCVGLDASETPRDISFCGHAILGREIFLIPDATKDERFADNPLVTGPPDIRFYAGCPLHYANGENLGTLCIIDQRPREMTQQDLADLADLAETVEHELRALQLATSDELTGMPNRRAFFMLAKNSLCLCTRENIPASLVFFDLDGFKQINDEQGHAEGDRALLTFSENLERICRDSDVAARLGGDEFVALFPNAEGSVIESIMFRLQQQLDSFCTQESLNYRIRFSYGVEGFVPGCDRTVEELLARGDTKMYERKRSQRVG